MSAKHSAASKARWAKVPKEQRIKKMRKLAERKQRLMTVEERKKHALNMVYAKQGKGKKSNGN